MNKLYKHDILGVFGSTRVMLCLISRLKYKNNPNSKTQRSIHQILCASSKLPICVCCTQIILMNRVRVSHHPWYSLRKPQGLIDRGI